MSEKNISKIFYELDIETIRETTRIKVFQWKNDNGDMA